MTKRIKHLSDLPKWFHLDKYNDAKKLDANGWYEQLCIRTNALWYLDSDENSNCKKITQTESFKETMDAIRNKPIYDLDKDGKISFFFYFHNIEIAFKSQNPRFIPGINVLSLLDFHLIKKEIEPKRLEYVEKWEKQFEEIYEKKSNICYGYASWIKKPIHDSLRQNLEDGLLDSGRDPILIDLNYPDKILIENFKKYLSARRSELKKENLAKPCRQCNFTDWIYYGALPYIDLKLWELENNIKIPLRVFADAIYPLGEGGEETVRKTTIPLVNLLLIEEMLRQLIAEASIDLEEKSKHKLNEFTDLI